MSSASLKKKKTRPQHITIISHCLYLKAVDVWPRLASEHPNGGGLHQAESLSQRYSVKLHRVEPTTNRLDLPHRLHVPLYTRCTASELPVR